MKEDEVSMMAHMTLEADHFFKSKKCFRYKKDKP